MFAVSVDFKSLCLNDDVRVANYVPWRTRGCCALFTTGSSKVPKLHNLPSSAVFPCSIIHIFGTYILAHNLVVCYYLVCIFFLFSLLFSFFLRVTYPWKLTMQTPLVKVILFIIHY